MSRDSGAAPFVWTTTQVLQAAVVSLSYDSGYQNICRPRSGSSIRPGLAKKLASWRPAPGPKPTPGCLSPGPYRALWHRRIFRPRGDRRPAGGNREVRRRKWRGRPSDLQWWWPIEQVYGRRTTHAMRVSRHACDTRSKLAVWYRRWRIVIVEKISDSRLAVKSGSIKLRFVEFSEFSSEIERVRCTVRSSFLVRNWCGVLLDHERELRRSTFDQR